MKFMVNVFAYNSSSLLELQSVADRNIYVLGVI